MRSKYIIIHEWHFHIGNTLKINATTSIISHNNSYVSDLNASPVLPEGARQIHHRKQNLSLTTVKISVFTIEKPIY